MTHTRWKLLAGCFGIAMCGLAALAGASRQSPLAMGCDYRPLVTDEPRHVAAVIPVQPVLTKAVEKKLEEAGSKPPVVILPTLPPVNVEPLLSIQPTPIVVEPKRADVIPAPMPSATMTLPRPDTNLGRLQLPSPTPSIDLPPLAETKSNPTTPAVPQLSIPEPAQTPMPTVAPSAPANPPITIAPQSSITLPSITSAASNDPAIALSIPGIPPIAIDPTQSTRVPDQSQTPPPMVELPGLEKKAEPPAPLNPPAVISFPPIAKAATAEKKVEVPVLSSIPDVTMTIRMTGGSPTVELRSTTGAFLTISCEQLDIAARGPKDDLPSSIKASGKVKFTASGCQGTCEELVFNPKSMDGTLRNAVKVLCTHGGTSTEFTADQIAFQLLTESTKSVVSFQAQGSGMMKK